MTFWVDAQLSPSLAPWLAERFAVEAYSVKELGYRDATDRAIFNAARVVGAVVITKDSDFVNLLEQYGPPPQVLWVTLGNTSNAYVRAVFAKTFERALAFLRAGEPLVEIGGAV
jgi:predicted nuclease of predicted toxin-antitoxin system